MPAMRGPFITKKLYKKLNKSNKIKNNKYYSLWPCSRIIIEGEFGASCGILKFIHGIVINIVAFHYFCQGIAPKSRKPLREYLWR